jgi:hypothetical protein
MQLIELDMRGREEVIYGWKGKEKKVNEKEVWKGRDGV